MLAPVLEVTLHELIVPEGFSQPWTNFLIRDVSRWRHCAAFSSAVDTHIRWFDQVIWKDIPRRIKLSNCYKSSTKMVYRRKLFANFEAFCAKVRLDKFVLHDSLRRESSFSLLFDIGTNQGRNFNGYVITRQRFELSLWRVRISALSRDGNKWSIIKIGG